MLKNAPLYAKRKYYQHSLHALCPIRHASCFHAGYCNGLLYLKKNIVHFLGNKQQLVEAVVLKQVAESNHYIRSTSGISHNALTEIIGLFKCGEFVAGLFPAIFCYELKRYYHEAYNFVTVFFNDSMRGRYLQNMSRGMDEGCYKADLDKDMVVSIHGWQMQNAMEDVGGLYVDRIDLVRYINQCFLSAVMDLNSVLSFPPDWKMYMKYQGNIKMHNSTANS